MVLRVILIILLAIVILTQSYYLAGVLYIVYLFKYTGYEIVVLAVLIDGYYGAFYNFPTFTTVTLMAWMAVTYLKKLLLYNRENEFIS